MDILWRSVSDPFCGGFVLRGSGQRTHSPLPIYACVLFLFLIIFVRLYFGFYIYNNIIVCPVVIVVFVYLSQFRFGLLFCPMETICY